MSDARQHVYRAVRESIGRRIWRQLAFPYPMMGYIRQDIPHKINDKIDLESISWEIYEEIGAHHVD